MAALGRHFVDADEAVLAAEGDRRIIRTEICIRCRISELIARRKRRNIRRDDDLCPRALNGQDDIGIIVCFAIITPIDIGTIRNGRSHTGKVVRCIHAVIVRTQYPVADLHDPIQIVDPVSGRCVRRRLDIEIVDNFEITFDFFDKRRFPSIETEIISAVAVILAERRFRHSFGRHIFLIIVRGVGDDDVGDGVDDAEALRPDLRDHAGDKIFRRAGGVDRRVCRISEHELAVTVERHGAIHIVGDGRDALAALAQTAEEELPVLRTVRCQPVFFQNGLARLRERRLRLEGIRVVIVEHGEIDRRLCVRRAEDDIPVASDILHAEGDGNARVLADARNGCDGAADGRLCRREMPVVRDRIGKHLRNGRTREAGDDELFFDRRLTHRHTDRNGDLGLRRRRLERAVAADDRLVGGSIGDLCTPRAGNLEREIGKRRLGQVDAAEHGIGEHLVRSILCAPDAEAVFVHRREGVSDDFALHSLDLLLHQNALEGPVFVGLDGDILPVDRPGARIGARKRALRVEYGGLIGVVRIALIICNGRMREDAPAARKVGFFRIRDDPVVLALLEGRNEIPAALLALDEAMHFHVVLDGTVVVLDVIDEIDVAVIRQDGVMALRDGSGARPPAPLVVLHEAEAVRNIAAVVE